MASGMLRSLFLLIIITVIITVCQSTAPDPIEYHQDKPRCEPGWVPNWQELTCVKFDKIMTTWTVAQYYCAKYFARRIAITTKEKIEFLFNNTDRSWSSIGYWIDGQHDPQAWNPYHIIAGPPEYRCMKINALQGADWANCKLKIPYICERDVDLRAPTNCTFKWTYVRADREVCLKAFKTQDNFDDSDYHCVIRGGTLAMPTSTEMHQAILRVGARFLSRVNYWIGIHASPITGMMEYADGSRVPGCWMMGKSRGGMVPEDTCGKAQYMACERQMDFRKSYCEGKWQLYYEEGKCIKFFNGPKSKPDASSSCTSRNGSLINITDKRKLDFVIHPSVNPSNDSYLIDSWYEEEYDYGYIPKEYWSPTKYLSGNRHYGCTRMEENLIWTNYSSTLPFICERQPDEVYKRPYSPVRVVRGRFARGRDVTDTSDAYTCPDGWTYHHITQSKAICMRAYSRARFTCYHASTFCQYIVHGELAMPSSEERYKIIKKMQHPQNSPYWVGIKHIGYRKTVFYSDGTEVSECRWVGRNETGLTPYKNCSEPKPFICEKPVEHERTDVLTCPNKWLFYWEDRMCVGYFMTLKTMTDADTFCKRQNSTITNIMSPRKETFIMHSRNTPTRDYWVGDTYEHPETWSPIQDMGGNLEDVYCVASLGNDFSLWRMPCDLKKRFVCQFKADSAKDCPKNSGYYDDGRERLCLVSSDTPLTRNLASNACRRNGGILATPLSQRKLEAIKDARKRKDSPHWIGIEHTPRTRFLQYDNSVEVPTCRAMKPFSEGIGGYQSCHIRKLVTCERPMEHYQP